MADLQSVSAHSSLVTASSGADTAATAPGASPGLSLDAAFAGLLAAAWPAAEDGGPVPASATVVAADAPDAVSATEGGNSLPPLLPFASLAPALEPGSDQLADALAASNQDAQPNAAATARLATPGASGARDGSAAMLDVAGDAPNGPMMSSAVTTALSSAPAAVTRSVEAGLAVMPDPASGATPQAALGHPPSSAAEARLTTVPTPVAQPGWDRALGERVLWLANRAATAAGATHIDQAALRLHPAELGPLDVRISLHDDGARISFGSGHALVREALEAAMPRLREMLADNGIQLLDASVSDHANHRAAHSEQAPQRGSHDATAGAGLAAEDGGLVADLSAVRAGLIDYYA